jgi:hypothetical protein
MALNNDDIKQLIAILQKGLGDEETIKNTQKSTKSNKSKKIPQKLKRGRAGGQHDVENQFLSMGVHNMHKDDTTIDNLLKKGPPTPRNRNFKPIQVTCRSCGKKENISPVLLYETPDRYKCNSCASSAG